MFTLSVIHNNSISKKKEILTLAPSIFAIFFYNIPASELLPLKNFRKRYLLYDGAAISKLQNRKTFRGRRLFPSKVSEQSRFCRLFRENENASCKTHIHNLWKYPSSRSIDNASTIQRIFCHSTLQLYRCICCSRSSRKSVTVRGGIDWTWLIIKIYSSPRPTMSRLHGTFDASFGHETQWLPNVADTWHNLAPWCVYSVQASSSSIVR